MKRSIKVVATLCLGLFAQNALADQCAYVSKREASEAAALVKKLLKKNQSILAYCELCDDATPIKIKVQSVGIQNVNYPDNNGQPQYELLINGQGVDLAYTFVPTSSKAAINLSKAVDCTSDSVSAFIAIP